MAGLMNKPMMRDQLPQEEVSGPISETDRWALSLTKPGDMDPVNPKHAPEIERMRASISQGQLSEKGVANLAKLNPKAAPALYDAYTNYAAGTARQKDVQGIVGKYISPGTGGEGDYETPPTDPREDPKGLVMELASNPGLRGVAKEYSDLYGLDKKKSVGYYGGVQSGVLASDKKTVVPWTIDEATGKTVRLDTGQEFQLGKDVLATTPMGFQTVMGPGGIPSIVQIPSRGVPGQAPTVTPSGQMPDKNFTPETAGKLKMLDQGMSDAQRAKEMIFDEKGELKTGLLAKANVPFTSGIGGEARILYSAIKNAVASKYRGETGAAGNAGEVEDMTRRFMPSVLDTKESAADKLDRLEEFLGSAYDIVDPAKVYPRIAKPMKPRSVQPADKGGVSPAKGGVSKEDIMKEIQRRRSEGRM